MTADYSDALPDFAPLDAEIVGEQQPARQTRSLVSRLLTLDQLEQQPPATALVDGLLYRGTLAQLSAAAGSYKSFAAVAIACSVALGRNLDTYTVPTAARVLYIAAEGAQGLAVRIAAWCELNGADRRDLDGHLQVLAAPVQLGNSADVAEAAAIVANFQPGLLIIDTRARCTVGLDENSSKEQGVAIDALERIMSPSPDCTALVIHHTGRAGSNPRGSSAWDGAVWSDLRMEGADTLAKITCSKHKDAPDSCEHHFRLVPHTVAAERFPGHPESARSTLVFVQNDAWTPRLSSGKAESTILDIIWTCAMTDGMSKAEVRDAAAEHGVKKSTAYASMNALVEKGLLLNVGTDTRPRFTVSAAGRTHLTESA